MVLLSLRDAKSVRFGNAEALRVRIANKDIWVKPDTPVETSSLISRYNFDETGDTFLDSSGNNRHVTIDEATQRTTTSAKVGTGAAKAAVLLAAGTALAPYNNAASRTVMGWASLYLQTGIWIIRMQTAADSGAFGLYLQDNVLKGRVRVGGVPVNVEYPGVLPVLGEWYHVALSYDSVTGVANLYLDGTLRATTTIPGGGIIDTANGYDLAADGSVPGTTPNGWAVDQLEFHNKALSASEILAHRNAAPPKPQFAVNWNEGTGASSANRGSRGGTILPTEAGPLNWGPGKNGGGSGKSTWYGGNQPTGSSQWTAMADYRLTEALPLNGRALFYGASSLYYFRLWQATSTSDGMALEYSGDGETAAILLPHNISPTDWWTLAIVCDGIDVKVYQNGVLVKTFITKKSSLRGVQQFGEQGSTLELDNYRIFDVALTPEQISAASITPVY